MGHLWDTSPTPPALLSHAPLGEIPRLYGVPWIDSDCLMMFPVSVPAHAQLVISQQHSQSGTS